MCQIRVEGGHVKVGGTVWNTLKEGGTEKRGGETKILKRGGGSWVELGALKRGTGTPLRTLYIPVTFLGNG